MLIPASTAIVAASAVLESSLVPSQIKGTLGLAVAIFGGRLVEEYFSVGVQSDVLPAGFSVTFEGQIGVQTGI